MTQSNENIQEFNAAVVREKGGLFEIEKVHIKGIRDDEILVKVKATGMCHTDMIVRDQLYEVPMPLVLGHEGSGVVEKVGASVKEFQPGDHVVLSFASCGKCTSCLKAKPTYCENFFQMNFGGGRADDSTALKNKKEDIHDHFFGQSSFGAYAVSTERNTVKVDKDIPLELLGPLGCGIQTGAGAILNALKVGPGESVVVFGTGAVGLSAIMAAKIAGASTIVAVDVVPERLEQARSLGATHTFNSKDQDPVEEIQKLIPGGIKYSLEATGRPNVLRQAIDCLGINGTCGIVGAPALGVEATFDVNGLMVPGKTIKGIIEGDSNPKVFIPQLIQYYREGRFPFDKLTKFYQMDQINEAAQDSEKGITVKPIIYMN